MKTGFSKFSVATVIILFYKYYRINKFEVQYDRLNKQNSSWNET
jgi:hypothetical protein